MKKMNIKKYIFEILVFTATLIYIIPTWMVVVNSFKSQKDAAFFGMDFSGKIYFENYLTVFKEANIDRAFLNGIFLAGSIGILAIIFSSMASYAITRIKSKVTELAYFIFISGIVLPGAIIPTFFILQKLRLINTYTGVILVLLSMTMPISIFLYSGFMKTIPKDLDEAGIIDGSGKLALFFKIIFPLLKPTTITIVIFNFMGVWNDITTQLYFTSADKWTMPMMVYRFQGMYSSEWNLIFADIILTSIPVIIVFIIGQKHIVSGMTVGAVKG